MFSSLISWFVLAAVRVARLGLSRDRDKDDSDGACFGCLRFRLTWCCPDYRLTDRLGFESGFVLTRRRHLSRDCTTCDLVAR